MSNAFDEMRLAMIEAQSRVRAADSVAGEMARLLRGRLKFCPNNLVADLKKELRDFNIHTKEWTK